MKIEQKKTFSPIVITLENVDDFYCLESIIAFYDGERDTEGSMEAVEMQEQIRIFLKKHRP